MQNIVKSKIKIVTRLCGGIGNQLFIYAASRRLALINNAELVIDSISGFRYDKIYKRQYQLHNFNIPCRLAKYSERLEPLSRIRRMAKRKWNLLLKYQDRSYIRQDALEFDSRLLDFKPHGTLYLEGYWQSEKYFIDVESKIREELAIKEPADIKNQQLIRYIKQTNSVAVHIRFFSIHSGNEDDNIEIEYYNRAIELINRVYPNAHYYIFSDNCLKAYNMINIEESRKTIVSHNDTEDTAYADLWLMSNCKHFIISNSTFSWWGAWLSSNPNKMVVAPSIRKSDGASAWGFEGLMPEKWIKV